METTNTPNMETTNTQNVEHTAQEQEQTQKPEQEKRFTQEELEEKIRKRIEKERKKYPSEESLAEFQKWKESQQTEQQKWQNLQKEKEDIQKQFEQLQQEAETLKREHYLLSKGISIEDVDYYAFKIGKQMKDEDDFETVANDFVKEKRKQLEEKNKQKETTIVSFGSQADNGAKMMSLGEEINRKLRGDK